MPQWGEQHGSAFNRHVTDNGNIWNISFPSLKAMYRAVRAESWGLQTSQLIAKLTIRFAVSNQNALAEAVVLCLALFSCGTRIPDVEQCCFGISVMQCIAKVLQRPCSTVHCGCISFICMWCYAVFFLNHLDTVVVGMWCSVDAKDVSADMGVPLGCTWGSVSPVPIVSPFRAKNSTHCSLLSKQNMAVC